MRMTKLRLNSPETGMSHTCPDSLDRCIYWFGESE
jgi:hypothetical protein